MNGEDASLRAGLMAFIAEARRFADQVGPLVSSYETKSGEFLAGVCGAVLASVAAYLLQRRYALNLSYVQVHTVSLLMLMLGAALMILLFRGPGRWKAENRKAKVKTLIDQMNVDLAAMRSEIDTLNAAQAPADVMRRAWADYESALHQYIAVRVSTTQGTAQKLCLKPSRQ